MSAQNKVKEMLELAMYNCSWEADRETCVDQHMHFYIRGYRADNSSVLDKSLTTKEMEECVSMAERVCRSSWINADCIRRQTRNFIDLAEQARHCKQRNLGD
jgi:hypothetical protein